MDDAAWVIINDGGKRLESRAKLTPDDFHAIARALGMKPVRARKIGFVAAREAGSPEKIETRWNGTGTTNIARPGDFIVINLSPDRLALRDGEGLLNVYVIVADLFTRLYEPVGEHNEHGAIYRAKGVVSALPLPGGFDILAPWGERQTAASGYLLLNGNQVGGGDRDTFVATYEILRD
jgi:hypothetical protein